MSVAYEYSQPTELDATSSNYFAIPASIILDSNVNDKRVTAFSFFSVRRGLDCCVTFSINNIVKWTGRSPNRHANGINEKFTQAIEYLADKKFISLSEKITKSAWVDAYLDLSAVSKKCEHERFAVIYLDELKKILDYRNLNSKDNFLNNDIILLVFAYLRMIIYRRRNRLLPEETNIGNKNNHKYDIETRRIRSPEAYDCYYYEIAEELGLSARAVSKAVGVLNELGLIYSESLPRINIDGKWRTDRTIFCNAYKREGGYLLDSGSSYYLSEVEKKKRKLKL